MIPVVGRRVHAYADHMTPPDYMAVSVQEELGMRVDTEALDHCGYHKAFVVSVTARLRSSLLRNS